MKYWIPKDIWYLLMNQLCDKDLCSMFLVNKYLWSLGQDNGFWERRLDTHFSEWREDIKEIQEKKIKENEIQEKNTLVSKDTYILLLGLLKQPHFKVDSQLWVTDPCYTDMDGREGSFIDVDCGGLWLASVKKRSFGDGVYGVYVLPRSENSDFMKAVKIVYIGDKDDPLTE